MKSKAVYNLPVFVGGHTMHEGITITRDDKNSEITIMLSDTLKNKIIKANSNSLIDIKPVITVELINDSGAEYKSNFLSPFVDGQPSLFNDWIIKQQTHIQLSDVSVTTLLKYGKMQSHLINKLYLSFCKKKIWYAV